VKLRNSEILEQVSVDECLPQPANPREFIATKGSVELVGSLDKEIDAVCRRDRPLILGLDKDVFVYLGGKVLPVIKLPLSAMCSAVLARTRGRRSRTRNDGTGGIPEEKTRGKEVQIKSAICPLARKHPSLHTAKNLSGDS